MLNRLRRLFRPPIQPQPVTVYEGQLFAGKKVFITGAGGRLGEAMISGLQRQQATVWFNDLNAERVRELEKSCAGAVGIAADIRETEKIVQRLDAGGFLPDLLVNLVGISAEKPFLQETDDDWQNVFQTNVFAPMRLTKAIVQRMIAQQRMGNILFITSVHQTLPRGWPSYSASKAALQMVVKELALELAPHDIRVNGIAPGWVDPMPQSFRTALLRRSTIDPTYIAHAVAFLGCDTLSRFTTGEVLVVDACLVDQP